jgi:Zn finger protein HypA/HybF involved in hydrogenase expression
MKYNYNQEQLENAVKNNLSLAGVCRELGIRPVGGNYKTLKSKILLWKINISHFTGKAWCVGSNFKYFGKKYILNDILIDDSPYMSSTKLKKRLFSENIKTKKCEICNITTWNNKQIVFELDHINGINTDNRIENLRIICPNCHSQTANYRGKNKLSALSEKREVEYRKFRETPVLRNEAILSQA